MSLLILSRKIIAILALCTGQDDLNAHRAHLPLFSFFRFFGHKKKNLSSFYVHKAYHNHKLSSRSFFTVYFCVQRKLLRYLKV